MFTVEWARKAIRQLKRFDRQHQKQIVVAVRSLKNWPNCEHVKFLKDRAGYRLRVGRYRVFFEVEKSLRIIMIEEVKKRDERTY
ncbi:MAG: type II toxin-antitoxin system RelE/ParE family toxin [Anaerolineae bacterium]